jgi:hypothetical protein
MNMTWGRIFHVGSGLNSDFGDEPVLDYDPSGHWQATEEEHASLLQNNTFILVPRPCGANVVKTRWVYKVKVNADGTIDHYKAWWVAKGYSQVQGVDYEETFAPIVCLENLCYLLAYVNVLNLKIHQMDVKSAFLHTHLKEEVYCTQPEGFESEQGGMFLLSGLSVATWVIIQHWLIPKVRIILNFILSIAAGSAFRGDVIILHGHRRLSVTAVRVPLTWAVGVAGGTVIGVITILIIQGGNTLIAPTVVWVTKSDLLGGMLMGGASRGSVCMRTPTGWAVLGRSKEYIPYFHHRRCGQNPHSMVMRGFMCWAEVDGRPWPFVQFAVLTFRHKDVGLASKDV